jgi:hypothetical protein
VDEALPREDIWRRGVSLPLGSVDSELEARLSSEGPCPDTVALGCLHSFHPLCGRGEDAARFDDAEFPIGINFLLC